MFYGIYIFLNTLQGGKSGAKIFRRITYSIDGIKYIVSNAFGKLILVH